MDRAFRDVFRRSISLTQLRSSPKVASASEIRKTFIDYFCEEHKHLYIRSSPVFSLKDPTLAFTNAGMNQFKDVFLGLLEPASSRVANSQKCIRIGGAHNDLNQVGQDGTHHTFFEMLGNWSFGDYFKEDACRMSWNLLTQVYNIPPERLYVTYFEGNEALGLSPDVEVQEIWRQIGVKDSHILPFGTKENFWSGNVIGPCGPCTEIHYDHCQGRTDAGKLVNAGSDEVTELWNIVFTEFDKKASGELVRLKKHFVDTGMGLERLVAVLQGKTSNYDTDLFQPLFEVIRKETGHSGYMGRYDGNAVDCCYRVLADHSRMIAVALSDGMIPNHQNKVRGIIRKSLSVAQKIFGAKPDLLKELANHVAEILSDTYPEIGRNLFKIHYIIDEEVETAKKKNEKMLIQWQKLKRAYPTLNEINIQESSQILSGLEYLHKNVLALGKRALTGEDIFILYDTYGVPVPMTEHIALKLGIGFDMVAFVDYEHSKKTTDREVQHKKYHEVRDETSYLDILAKLEEKNIRPTLDYFKHDYRVDGSGKYIFNHQETTIEAILCGKELLNEISAEDLKGEQEVGLILDRTQLFSEEGNQASDSGTLTIEGEILFDIKKLIKIKNFVIHFGNFRNFPSNGKVSVQSLGVLELDESRRVSIMRNHTGLHIMNAFLRKELDVTGEKFSRVTPNNIVLDFLVYKKNLHLAEGDYDYDRKELNGRKQRFPMIKVPTLGATRRYLLTTNYSFFTDMKKLEKFVKDFITLEASVKRKLLSHPQFQALEDVVFVPGENILSQELPVVEINSGFNLSREYCTGTHLLNASHLDDFVVMKFLKGSNRVQRIEAITGEYCARVRKSDSEMQKKWSQLKKEIPDSSQWEISQLHVLEKRLKQLFSEVTDSTEISHFCRITISHEIQEEKKNIVFLEQASIRNFLRSEILKASKETSDKCVVRCLECSWQFNPDDLEVATKEFTDKPVLILLKCDDSVSIQCVVPKHFVSQEFTARKWLTDSAFCLGGIAKCKAKQNPNLVYFLSNRKATQAQINQIVQTAVKFAEKNLRIM